MQQCVSVPQGQSISNRNRACDFLLVRHSNDSNLAPLQKYCRLFGAQLYSAQFLEVFLLDQIANVGVNLSRYLIKLFGREIIFEVFQPV